MRKRLTCSFPYLLAIIAACGDSQDSAGGGSDAGPDDGLCFSSNECPTGWTCTEFGTCEPPLPMTDGGLPPPPPPEVEREVGEPSSTLRYVYVAMPEIDSLAKIDGATLAVTSVPVGDRPGLVVAIPGADDALVLDRGSDTATIVRPTVDRDERVTLPILPRLNVVAMAPTGGYAVAYFDLTRAVIDAGGIDQVGEIGSFQDVSVIRLARDEEVAAELSVGFRPREVEFDDAGTHAYVVTEDGISIIDLAEAAGGDLHVAATIPIAEPFTDPGMLEVEITDDGLHAVVRELGRAELRVIELGGVAPGTTYVLTLPAEATDVDLKDGRAYAVLRDTAQLALVDIPADAITPAGIELVDLGSETVGLAVLSPAGDTALLFTNASNVERLVVVDLVAAGHPHVVKALEKGVRMLAFAPDGQTALVLHSNLPGDPGDTTNVDDFVDRSYGYSLFDLATGFAKLQLTPVDPGSFAFAPDSSRAWLALDGGDSEGAVARVQELDLGSFVVDDIDLGTPPEQIGVLPGAGVVFVNQRHPLGRVTFLDLVTGATRTVTGFELNSHIVD